MALAPQLRLFHQDALTSTVAIDGTLELGRQRAGEPEPFALLPATAGGTSRLVIAPQKDKDNISRRHLSVEPLPDGRVRVSNHSQAVLETDGLPIPADSSADLVPPFTLTLPGRTLEVIPADSGDEHGIHSLDQRTLGPGSADLSLDASSLLCLRPDQMRALLDGVTRSLGVLQSAVGGASFLDSAAGALVKIVGFDIGRVLQRKEAAWEVAAAHGSATDTARWHPSRHIIARMLATRSAVWQHPRSVRDPDSASLQLLDSVVAAPLLDRDNEVIGALYGERRKDGPQAGRADSQVEMLLVNLLACGVSTGLARMEQEKAAHEATALFGQFFTPELARHLARDPTLLEGRNAEVTILFADVRGFSKHSEKLGAATAIRWMNGVLDALSRCVRDESGVLVDYVGDELMAMWGAPEPQPDQAMRAVRAALAMQATLAPLNERWQATLGEPIAIGIGINSGTAQVGNVGSTIKFKYGPLGNTVNLASRVQGLTKYLRSALLVTAATRQQLDDDFIARRVVKTRVVNIDTPVDVFEVERRMAADRQTVFEESTAALDDLERSQFASAARAAGVLLGRHPGDGTMLLVLARAADALVNNGVGFDPVWSPPGK